MGIIIATAGANLLKFIYSFIKKLATYCKNKYC